MNDGTSHASDPNGLDLEVAFALANVTALNWFRRNHDLSIVIIMAPDLFSIIPQSLEAVLPACLLPNDQVLTTHQSWSRLIQRCDEASLPNIREEVIYRPYRLHKALDAVPRAYHSSYQRIPKPRCHQRRPDTVCPGGEQLRRWEH